MDAGSRSSHGEPLHGTIHNGSAVRQEEHSKEETSLGDGGRIFTAARDGREAGEERAQKPIPWTREHGHCQGEALLW